MRVQPPDPHPCMTLRAIERLPALGFPLIPMFTGIGIAGTESGRNTPLKPATLRPIDRLLSKLDAKVLLCLLPDSLGVNIAPVPNRKLLITSPKNGSLLAEPAVRQFVGACAEGSKRCPNAPMGGKCIAFALPAVHMLKRRLLDGRLTELR